MKPAKNNNSQFGGPLFVIGVSRSGTKLLRDLLNNHSLIGIPVIESKFIPSFYRKFGGKEEQELKQDFHTLYRHFRETVFFAEMAKTGKSVGKETWYGSVEKWTLAGVIEALFKILAARDNKTIWGDKTPNYLLYVPLLKTLFPQARFIHLIRDARDGCLSARKAWNRNIYYSAQRWVDYIRQCREDTQQYAKNDYFELKYEELIMRPAELLGKICEFLGIKYEEGMDSLGTPAEEVGDTKGRTEIVTDNLEKWKKEMTARQLRKVEKISGTLLEELGYPVSGSFNGKTGRLTVIEINIYRFLETLHLFRKERKKKNISGAVKAVSDKFKSRLGGEL